MTKKAAVQTKSSKKDMMSDLPPLMASPALSQPSDVFFIIYDTDKNLRKIVKDLQSQSTVEITHLKHKPAKKPETLLNKIQKGGESKAQVISHLHLTRKDAPPEATPELLQLLDSVLPETRNLQPIWLAVPIAFLETFCEHARKLWDTRRDFFWLESRDLDRYRRGFYLCDPFAETTHFSSVRHKEFVLRFYHLHLEKYPMESGAPGMVFSLAGKIAILQFQMGNYAQALRYLQQQHRQLKQLRNKKLLPELLNNIAVVYQHLGRYSEAMQRLEQAQKAAEKSLRGTHHPGKIMITSNLGMLHCELGNFREAFQMTRQALRMGESKIGMKHEGLVPLLLNFAQLLCERGNYEDALDHYRRGLKIVELRLGLDHPYMSYLLQKIGMVYYYQQKYDLARRYVYRTLEAMERALGPEHPYMGILFNNIGVTHLYGKHYDLALKYFDWALNIRHKRIGENDPLIGTIHANIGKVYLNRGETENAQMCYLKARETLSRYHPESHPRRVAVEKVLQSLEMGVVAD